MRRGAFAAALAAALAASARASAQPKTPKDLPERGAVFALDGKEVVMTASFRDAFDAALAKKLTSGLPTVVTMRGYVYPDGSSTPIALAAKSCRIVYDLWDEVFRIQLTDARGARAAVALNTEGVLRTCAEARRMPLVPRAMLDGRLRYFVGTLVEVNPVSPAVLERIKKWVTRPSNAIGPGDSLFGSFVGLFVARIDDADRKLAFRTTSFTPPNPPPAKSD